MFYFCSFFLSSLARSICRYKHQDEDLLPNADTFTLSPHRIKCHHPNCPKANQNTPTMDGSGGRRLKSQMPDTNSISGTIVIQNNCNNSQLSSPDVSETNEIHKYSTGSGNAATTNSGNDEKDEKHRSGLLKIPGVIKTEQQSVSGIRRTAFAFVLAFNGCDQCIRFG